MTGVRISSNIIFSAHLLLGHIVAGKLQSNASGQKGGDAFIREPVAKNLSRTKIKEKGE
jgi:hypothetical protein